MIIEAIQNQIISGTKQYPVYIAFMSAADILSVAEVPAFGHSTAHDVIASNVLTPPIREWQRPIDLDRVNGIAETFNNTGELMPNPVLLAENVAGNSNSITVNSKLVAGLQSGLVEVHLASPANGQAKQLWILDGQHRINGLSKSLQSSNVVPVVMLLNHGGAYYDGPLMAKIFAQVTTTAHKLDDLHNEWLTFAFKLGQYSPSSPGSTQHCRAMEAVAALCRTPQFGGITNPFFNKVKFNSHMQSQAPTPGGFAYTCIELEKLISAQYYMLPITGAGGSYLSPLQLAEQIVAAHAALKAAVQSPSDSVFFGSPNSGGQKIMQDAFLAGVFASLLKHGTPTSWSAELNLLGFNSTNWTFDWVRSLNGAAATTSRDLAIRVFKHSFEARSLPFNSGTLADFLKGNEASVKIEFSPLNANGRLLMSGRHSTILMRGSITSQSIAPRKHVKVRPQTLNIGKVSITDKNSPPGRLVVYNQMTTGGIKLSETTHKNPLSLLITMEHYGGNTSTAEIDISW